MAKSKEKKDSQGHKRTKTDSKVASNRSQEFVGNSDSEDNNSAPVKVKKEKNSKQAPSQDNLKKSKSSKSKDPKPVSDEEDSSDDDSASSESSTDEEQEETVPKKSGKKGDNTNGVKRKAGEQSSSDEESEDESEEEEAPAAKRAKAEDTASSESEEDSSDDEKPSAPSASAPTQSNGKMSTAGQPYSPPSGYSKLGASVLSSSTDIKASSLAGKQIWHITAPSNVSLESISQLSLSAIQSASQSGKSVLSHKGVDYILAETPSQTASTAVLIPGNEGYTTAKQSISKSLRLQQHIVLPNLTIRQANQDTGSAAAADVATAAVSTVRPQPKGLRMRYKPAGYGQGNPGQIGSDTESDDGNGPSSSFQFPKTMGGHGPSEDTATSKKSKKKNKDKQGGQEDTVMTNGITPEKESKDEKAKRKEERRLKKEKKESKA